MPDKFAFVIADERGKPKKGDTGLIRSVCMRGRNVRDDSRRSKRRAKREQTIATNEWTKILGTQRTTDIGWTKHHIPIFGLLPSPATDLELVRFAGEVDDWSRAVLYKFLACGRASNLVYPIERHLNFHQAGDYIEWIAADKGCLHSLLLTASAINDFAMRQDMSPLTCSHLRQTLLYLNAKLSDPAGHTLDSTIFMIITLAITAAMFEEHRVTSTHIRGLQEIVKLRGGYEFLKSFPKIHFKIERLDLSRCLCTGSPPLFFSGPTSWEPFFKGSHPIPKDWDETEGLPLDEIASPKLAIVYSDLRALTSLINVKNETSSPVSIELFQSAIHSIQSRLLALRDRSENDTEECLRLGMLSMLTTTFRLPGKQMPYTYLATQLRELLQRARPQSEASRHIIFWTLIMSVIAVFELEDWMFEVWNRVAENYVSWDLHKKRLENVVWIGFVHDEPGQRACSKLSGRKFPAGARKNKTLQDLSLDSLQGELYCPPNLVVTV